MSTCYESDQLIHRPATPADTAQAAMLLHETMPWLDRLTGFDAAMSRQLIHGLYLQPNNRFAYEHIELLCTAEGQAAGLLMVLRGEHVKSLAWPTLRRALAAMPWRRWPGMLSAAMRLLPLHETEDHELYISHLAVHHDHRRRGIGRQLLQLAQQHAHDQQMPGLSLLCECDNTAAKELYQSAGFSIDREQRVGKVRFYRMVKAV